MPNASIHCLSLNPALDIAGSTDKVIPTHKIRVTDQQEFPGGGAINVARVINSLGGDVSLSYLAGGPYGNVLEQALTDLSIPNRRITTDSNTRLSYTIFEKSTKREYRFVASGAPIAKHFVDTAITYLESISCEILVLSGSLPFNSPIDTYAKIASSASNSGIKVVLDCSDEALKCALDSSSVYLVKPSFGELEQLAGKTLDEASAIQFAQSLVQQNRAAVVVVTMGRNGAFLCSRNRTLRAPAVRVDVQSAVGAGDSFVAGMISRLSNGKSIEEAFSHGIAAGAAAVMTSGTRLCQPENIHKLLDNVVVSSIG